MEIPFNKLFPYISSGYTPQYITKFTGELVFGFVPYVKSQIDVDVVSDLYNRNIFGYYGTYRFFKGNSDKKSECAQVLRFFYDDIASMICSVISYNPYVTENCTVRINTIFPNCSEFPVKRVVLADVREDLSTALSRGTVIDPGISSIFLKIKSNVLSDLKESDMLATAAILLAESKSKEIHRLEVVI